MPFPLFARAIATFRDELIRSLTTRSPLPSRPKSAISARMFAMEVQRPCGAGTESFAKSHVCPPRDGFLIDKERLRAMEFC